MVAAKSGGVSSNLLPLESVSTFPTQTFPPIASSSHSLELCASPHMLILMAHLNQLYRTALSGMLPFEGDYNSSKIVNKQNC